MQDVLIIEETRAGASPQVSKTSASTQGLLPDGSECHQEISESKIRLRGRVMATRLSHTQLHVGSNPTPATKAYMLGGVALQCGLTIP